VLARLDIPDALGITLNAPDRQPAFAPPVIEGICQLAS
jgi:hypothetical protein